MPWSTHRAAALATHRLVPLGATRGLMARRSVPPETDGAAAVEMKEAKDVVEMVPEEEIDVATRGPRQKVVVMKA